MVWFICDGCGDSIKKPKLDAHCYGCRAASFTCIDCSQVFDQASARKHVTCVTEHEKYALGATKPGGFAAGGFTGNGTAAAPKQPAAATGTQFLTTRPPWKCTLCNVSCTSQDTLLSHAAGTKHQRRVRAATAGDKIQPSTANGGAPAAAAEPAAAEPASAPADAEQQQDIANLEREGDTAVPKPAKQPKSKKRRTEPTEQHDQDAAAAVVASDAAESTGEPAEGRSKSKAQKRKRTEGTQVTDSLAAADLEDSKTAKEDKKNRKSKRDSSPPPVVEVDAALLKAVAKKLRKKGSMSMAAVAKLVRKLADSTADSEQDLAQAVTQQLVAAGSAKQDGDMFEAL